MAAKVIIFWDFDAQWGADRSRSPGGVKEWGMRDFINTERLLDVLEHAEVKACFAIVGATALRGKRPYHDPALVRRIANTGHEIASHGMKHEWLPGLGESKLCQVLRESKDALEQCIGNRVTSFVPPFNQPFDYFIRGSISLAERREAGKTRIDIPRLCQALYESGYNFTRISYAGLVERLLKQLKVNSKVHTSKVDHLCGVKTLRLTCKSGFGEEALRVLELAVQKNRVAVLYGHPHSLSENGLQSEARLVTLLEKIHAWRKQDRLEVMLPAQL